MDWLSIHDLITPTNPFAAVFFGIIILIIVTSIVWFETKEKKTALISLIVGVGTVLLLVFILNIVGFYK